MTRCWMLSRFCLKVCIQHSHDHMAWLGGRSEIRGEAEGECCMKSVGWTAWERHLNSQTLRCARVCACARQPTHIRNSRLNPAQVLVCLCLCMPVSEWCIAPYLPVPGHMIPVTRKQTPYAFPPNETLYPWVFLIAGSSDRDSMGPKLLWDRRTIYTVGYFLSHDGTWETTITNFLIGTYGTLGIWCNISQCLCKFEVSLKPKMWKIIIII